MLLPATLLFPPLNVSSQCTHFSTAAALSTLSLSTPPRPIGDDTTLAAADYFDTTRARLSLAEFSAACAASFADDRRRR